MNITALISQHIIEVHEGENWTESDISTTLEDVTVAEATALTSASVNTIAALVHHLTVWNRVMVQRINRVDVKLNHLNGFNVPPIQTEEEWQKLKQDNLKSAHELALAIKGFDRDLLRPILPSYSSAYKNLQGSCEHIHYHLGQIVLLKQFIRSLK